MGKRRGRQPLKVRQTTKAAAKQAPQPLDSDSDDEDLFAPVEKTKKIPPPTSNSEDEDLFAPVEKTKKIPPPASDSEDDLFTPVPAKKSKTEKTPPPLSDSDDDDLFAPVEKPIKKIVCGTCKMDFPSATLLIRHKEEKHKESVVLVCGFCRKKFKRKPEFNKHIKTHKKK